MKIGIGSPGLDISRSFFLTAYFLPASMQNSAHLWPKESTASAPNQEMNYRLDPVGIRTGSSLAFRQFFEERPLWLAGRPPSWLSRDGQVMQARYDSSDFVFLLLKSGSGSSADNPSA
jgi:hypothetical protein